jgi:hypothetical protein
MMKTSVLYAGFLLLVTLRTQAQPVARLHAVTFYDRQFITIETDSAAGTLVTNLPVSPYDLATTDGTLWMLAGGSDVERLLQIDAWTGEILAEKSFASSVTGGEGAMDFAPDGTALASKSSENVGTLFRIDMALTNVAPITTDGGLLPSLDGLAFDANGVLYGLNQNAGGFTLYTVSTNTGVTTAVGGLGITFPGTGGAVAGVAFALDGTLFAAAGNPTESRLYRVNKFTGAATLIGSVGFPGVSGICFLVPPPGPLAISRAGDQLRLSWPHKRGGVLESAAAVTGVWNSTTLPLTTNGTEAVAFVPRDEGQRYFRLAHYTAAHN